MTTPADTLFTAALRDLPPDGLRAVMAAAAARLAADGKLAVIESKEQAAALDDRVIIDVTVPQWTTEDGTARGVKIRALSGAQRLACSRRAHAWSLRELPVVFVKTPDGGFVPSPGQDAARDEIYRWRLVIEQTAAAIVLPAGLSPEIVEIWNADVILLIHESMERISPYPPAIIRAELTRLSGVATPVDPTSGDGGPDGASADLAGHGGGAARDDR